MAAVPTAEELKRLTPAERIKVLRAMELARKKELEEERKQVEEDLAAAEELIKDSEGEQEVDEALAQEEERRREERIQEETESLEERIAQDTPAAPATSQYGTDLYNTLERATQTLEQLYQHPDYTDRGKEQYQQSKAEVERAQGYRLTSEKLESDLGLATGILNRLKYRH
jgi:vacuolar-type H+-ATPase subunit I/STV1